MPTNKTTYDWEPTDGQLLSFDVTFTATPYRPAVVNGDADDCREAEGGITDIEVELRRVEVVWFGDESTLQAWHRGLDNSSWHGNFAKKAEAAVERECADELMAACQDHAEALHETALANRDEAREAEAERRLDAWEER